MTGREDVKLAGCETEVSLCWLRLAAGTPSDGARDDDELREEHKARLKTLSHRAHKWRPGKTCVMRM